MERLTTNKPVSEMNVIELAHNSCYGKDGNARYRDFETDIDARELAIKLLEQHADIPNEFTCDDDFDDFMADSLQYGTDDILGLIAVFYRNLWAMANLRGRLKQYEDLDEQGKLLKLPCAVGDTVYRVHKGTELSPTRVYDCRVVAVKKEYNTISIKLHANINEETYSIWVDNWFDKCQIGYEFFLTENEALQKMNETEGKE